MSDLRCTECGLEATYSDAQIADLHRTCGQTRDETHTWFEQ